MGLLGYIPDSKNTALSLACRELLIRYKRKEIPKAEFELEIAYLALPSIVELKYKHPPSLPPVARDYYSLEKKEEKSTLIKNNEQLRNYLEVKVSRENENNTNWKWLHELKRRLRKDLVATKKLQSVIESYPKDKFHETHAIEEKI